MGYVFLFILVVGTVNPYMLVVVFYHMLDANMDLNVVSWIQHGFLNYNNGEINIWNSVTLAHTMHTWIGCAEHLQHHRNPVEAQPLYKCWFKSEDAKKLRRQYHFNVFDIKDEVDLYVFVLAEIFENWDTLVDMYVPIESDEPITLE